MVEYGHVLPQPGEEQAWFEALSPELQRYLASLGVDKEKPGAPFLDPNPLNLTVGSSRQVVSWAWDNCNNLNSPATFQNAIWSTDNANVATVQFDGSVSAVGSGNASVLLSGQLNEGDGMTYVQQCPMVREAVQSTVNASPTITSISPSQGLVGAAIAVTITGRGFAPDATINAGSNISVSSVSVNSSTQITATFTPTNSVSAGGNQAITVSVNGQTSNSRNFVTQIPKHFVRFNLPPSAPNGVGPVVTLTDGTVVNLAGVAKSPPHQCGVYENFLFQLVDQQNTSITNGTVTVTEVFSNITSPPGPDPSVNPLDLATQGENDVQGLTHTVPTCLATNENQSLDMTWTVAVGSVSYQLSTILHITKGSFNGTLNVTSTITTP
jgi:hypothetical protein